MSKSKHQKIIELLTNHLQYFKNKIEGTDFALFYKPRHGWYIREILHTPDHQFLANYGDTFHIGKNYEQIQMFAMKAIFAHYVFGEQRELINIRKVGK